MHINKLNVNEIIENLLINKKVKFIVDKNETSSSYEILMPNIKPYINVEYEPNNDNSLFISISTEGNIYDYIIDNQDEDISIETIEEEIVNLKQLNSTMHKIQTKINQIKNLCQENDLQFDQIKYKFNC